MAPFQPVPNTAILVPRFQAPNGDVAENAFHVVGTDPFNVGGLASLCNVYLAWFVNLVAGISPQKGTSNDYSLIGVSATALDTDHSPIADQVPTGGSIAGTGGAGHANAGLTIGIKLLTGLRGRSYRGRVFWVGLGIGGIAADAQSVVPSYGAAIVADILNLKVAIHAASANWNLAVVSRFNKAFRSLDNPTGKRDAGLATPVTDVAISDFIIDFQRRRATAHQRHN